MSATDRAFVEGYASARRLRVEWEGEIGFGRECVGLLDPERDTYIAWTAGTAPRNIADAYHKADYIAVLGRGDGAEAQLATWCRQLAEVGAVYDYREKAGVDLAAFVFGHMDELTAIASSSESA